uniref:Zinc finger protein 654 n=1 Tax=Erpetoichthys calabaricus TaxID=27687 RepID=A0A8C4RNS0_ERPCA
MYLSHLIDIEYAGRWQVPLPQLQVLRTALCCFTRGIASFPAESEQIQYVLSSLALSFFELLLFFGKDEFIEDPLKDILESFQECLAFLSRYKNVYLRLVKQVIEEGGPWENPVLQVRELDHYLSSEISDFFEFRVRYLLACERIQEAVALSKSCIQHSEVGKNLYFQQAYLTCLYKASLYDHLQREIAGIDGKDAVEIICNTEREEKDDLLLNLCKVFLLQQLQNGDMYYIWDLIFTWSKLQLRGNSSKQDFLEECQQLLLAATNVKIIFPFMKVIKTELGIEGLQLCVELCAFALQMDLCDDPMTKSLVYKMIAYLLPNDLEVCRACALSVFFLERTVESYNTVYCLYIHPDQEYHVDMNLIRNHIRFELLRIIKRGLYFDPEFWNLIMLRTNCLPLMGEKAIFVSFQEDDDEKIMNNSTHRGSKYSGDCIQQTSNTANNFVSPSTSAPQTQIHEVDKSVVLPSSKINSEKDSCSVCSSNNHASKHRCLLCNREFLGGHIMRHAMGHLHKGTFTCVVCGRKIKRQTLMLKHLKAHVKKIKRRQLAQPGEMDNGCTPVENGTSTNCEHKPSAPHLKNKQKTAKQSTSVENHINQHITISQSQNDNPDSSVSGSDKLTDSLGIHRPNGSILEKKKGEGQEERFECPAQDCGKSFNRKWALKKHVRKVHPHDVKAHEYIMKWSKGKCQYCQRKFIHPQHYLDHLNRHGNDKKYFCLQMNCIERFKTAIDLSNHVKVHGEFQLRCAFAECKMTFSDCSVLHEHECKHYPALPVEERLVKNVKSCALSSAVVRDQGQISSSCSKTVAVEEPPLPNWKLRMESVEPKTYLQNLASKHNVSTDGDNDENIEQNHKSLVMRISSAEPLLNGHREEHNTSPAFSNLGENKTGKNEKEPDVDLGGVESTIKEYKPIENMHDLGTTEVNTERTNLSSISPENIADTAQNDAGNSTVKDSSLSKPPLRKVATEEAIPYGCISKKPFVRPPPSSYLDEQFISMPKRRKTSSQKVDSTANVQASAESHTTQRHRCSKCFTVFNDLEALDSHLAQKKCQSLFGFDSDEESK